MSSGLRLCALHPAPVFCRAACGRMFRIWDAPPPTQGDFLLLVQEKVTKEKDTVKRQMNLQIGQMKLQIHP
jgi:hypothetical protein